MSADVPFLPDTDAALGYGHALALADLPALVRTYLVTQRAIAAIPDGALQQKANLAHRSQMLREALEAAVEIDGPHPFTTLEVGGA